MYRSFLTRRNSEDDLMNSFGGKVVQHCLNVWYVSISLHFRSNYGEVFYDLYYKSHHVRWLTRLKFHVEVRNVLWLTPIEDYLNHSKTYCLVEVTFIG